MKSSQQIESSVSGAQSNLDKVSNIKTSLQNEALSSGAQRYVSRSSNMKSNLQQEVQSSQGGVQGNAERISNIKTSVQYEVSSSSPQRVVENTVIREKQLFRMIPDLNVQSSAVHYELGNEEELSSNMIALQRAKERCEIGPSQLVAHTQTILQETIQTEAANIIGQEGENARTLAQKKSQSQFLEMKLNQMKKKHKQLQDQLSQVSKYETSASTIKKTVNVSSAGKTLVSNRQSDTLLMPQVTNNTEMISMLIEGLNTLTKSSGKKEIEVLVQKSDLGVIIKDQLQKLNTLMAHYQDIKSERDIFLVRIECLLKENAALKDENLSLKEELKGTKAVLSDTRVELERMKTHFDLLERKYIELLKKKQEVKIINKETYREVIVEKPIEIIKNLVNQTIVKKLKEVRKIVRAKGHSKLTILEKLHVVNRDIHTPTIQTIEKIVEIPTRQIVEVDRVVERPIIIEKPVYMERTINVPQFIDRVVERPMVIEKPVYMERTVNVPQFIDRVVERPMVIEKPVYMERTVPVPIREEIQVPVIHEVHHFQPFIEREREHIPESTHFVSSAECEPVNTQYVGTSISQPINNHYVHDHGAYYDQNIGTQYSNISSAPGHSPIMFQSASPYVHQYA